MSKENSARIQGGEYKIVNWVEFDRGIKNTKAEFCAVPQAINSF